MVTTKLCNNLRQVVDIYVPLTKQYNLVLVLTGFDNDDIVHLSICSSMFFTFVPLLRQYCP